jgi:hypothetical protein
MHIKPEGNTIYALNGVQKQVHQKISNAVSSFEDFEMTSTYKVCYLHKLYGYL